MKVSFWSSILVLTATTLTFAMPGTATAFSTQITMERPQGDNDDVGFHVRGKITSREEGCLRRRVIDVFHDVDPQGPSSGDFHLGSTGANIRGRWRFASSLEPDKIYAVVRPLRVCEPDVSRSKRVDYD